MVSENPFRADQVGSLLRPPELLAARAAFKEGTLDRAALRAREDEAIAEAVGRQEATGLPVVVDGEFRRENFWIDFIAGIDGLTIGGADDDAAFSNAPDENAPYRPKVVRTTGRIGHAGVVLKDDFEFLQKCTTRTPKITLPSPTRAHVLGGRAAVDRDVYPDIDGFWSDLAGVYRDEIAGLEALGCRYIQIDDPYLANFVDPKQRAHLEELHGDTDALLERYVAALNDCMRARRPETTLAVHICRGNARSTWIASGGYGPIAEPVFSKLEADTLLLEYDDDRSGDFEPLRHVRQDATVVLGLLTTKRGELEDRAVVEQRIEDAARFVPKERLALSPQCGFASLAAGNLIAPDEQWRKLALVVDIAQEVWGRV